MFKDSKLPIATLINAAAVLGGSLIGLFLNEIIPENIETIVFQAIGLATIMIALKMMLRLPDGYLLIFVFSLILGGIFGELIQLDQIMNGLSNQLKSLFGINASKFNEGLITAFLLFCIGSMTIVGAIEEGISGKRELILVKSSLDFFSSIALASVYGIGVLFSIIPLLLFQGGISLAASRISKHINDTLIDMISAVGGVLIFGIAIRILDLGQIHLENLLPSLLVVIFLVKFKKAKNKKEH